jgi:hypothetical protein
MIIKYTETKSGRILINSIEDVITWKDIVDKYNIEAKASYLSEYPFYNFFDNKLEIWILIPRKVAQRMTAPHVVSYVLEIGKEYGKEKFESCKELIKKSEVRFKNIVNYVEEEETWNSES